MEVAAGGGGGEGGGVGCCMKNELTSACAYGTLIFSIRAATASQIVTQTLQLQNDKQPRLYTSKDALH